LAHDPKFVGGQLGFFGVLQTWARDLAYHLHLHFIVAGGGLSPDGTTWLPVRGKFLVPVKALSKIFRAKCRQKPGKKIGSSIADPLVPANGRSSIWRRTSSASPSVTGAY
jgi:hypothetical protein